MKGIICYFSLTGNTKLLAEYVSTNITSAKMELFNIEAGYVPMFEDYDIIAFLTYVDKGAPPKLMQEFIHNIPMQNNKPVFLIATCAQVATMAVKDMADLVESRGFKIIGGSGLKMPNSYPPFRRLGGFLAGDNTPGKKGFDKLNSFLSDVNTAIKAFSISGDVKEVNIKVNAILEFMVNKRRNSAHEEEVKRKELNGNLCKCCGKCVKGCPYKAIEMKDKPVFNTSKCESCWKCYNTCPYQAIHTKKFSRGVGSYKGPDETLKRKLQTK